LGPLGTVRGAFSNGRPYRERYRFQTVHLILLFLGVAATVYIVITVGGLLLNWSPAVYS
jgi:hypothetical protein